MSVADVESLSCNFIDVQNFGQQSQSSSMNRTMGIVGNVNSQEMSSSSEQDGAVDLSDVMLLSTSASSAASLDLAHQNVAASSVKYGAKLIGAASASDFMCPYVSISIYFNFKFTVLKFFFHM